VKRVFADTFYWVALTNPADLHSEVASRFDDLLSGGHVTTTEEVLAELLTFFAGDSDGNYAPRRADRYSHQRQAFLTG
jgi:predicted nucleic acid-binding protein